MNLAHLQFGNVLHIYDNTSVPFSGKVFVKDTKFAGNSSCPISDVKVCLMHNRLLHGTPQLPEALICGDTQSDGIYTRPVVIGRTIDSVQLSYNDHKFEPSKGSSFKNHTLIDMDMDYNNNDFWDVQKARVIVEIVGGLCNKKLGTSFVNMKILGCDWTGINTSPQK